MSEGTSRLARFVAELRRRHVFRVTATYAVAAFVVLEGAAELLIPAFELPESLLRVGIVLAALGLPLVAALAWVYELTPSGIRTMSAVDREAGVRGPEVGNMMPRVALLLITAIAVGGGGLWWLRHSAMDPPGSPQLEAGGAIAPASDEAASVPIRSLAVLPLESFSADPSQDYFAAGMHEALISQLSQLGILRVISRTSVMSYSAAGKSMDEIGRELGVEGVVEGSVLVDENRVRITVQLVHAPSDTHLWAEDYEDELTDVIGLQRAVAQDIARQIQGELDEQVDPIVVAGDPGTSIPEAAMEEMKGRMALSGGSIGELREAEVHFREALRHDSMYVPALVGMASSTFMLGMDSDQDFEMESVIDWVDRALELDPESGEARDLRALLDEFRDQRVPVVPAPAGVSPAGEAVTVEEGTRVGVVTVADSLGAGAPTVTELGSRVTAWVWMRQADRGPGSALRAARMLHSSGRPEEAEGLLRATVQSSPEFVPAWDELEHLFVGRRDLAAVVELRETRYEELGAPPDGFPTLEALEAAVEGDGAEGYWRWRLQELEARAEHGDRVSSVDKAACFAALGDHDLALTHLAEAVRREDPRLGTLRSDPVFDPLRSDPGFRNLLREVAQSRPSGRPGRGGGRGN